jgi:hypothetical protein
MANFNDDIQSVGGPNLPQPTVQNDTTARTISSATNLVSGGLDSILSGRKDYLKQLKEQQKNTALSQYEQDVLKISDAVDQGSINSVQAKQRYRTLTSQYISQHPMLTDAINETGGKILSNAGLGEVISKGTLQEQQKNALVSQAAQAGWVDIKSDPDTQEQQMRDWQAYHRNKDVLEAQQQNLTYQRGLIGLETDKVQLASAKQSYVTGGITQQNARVTLAKNTAEYEAQRAVGGMVDAYGAKHQNEVNGVLDQVNSGKMSKQDGIIALNQIDANISQQIRSGLGGFGLQYADNMTTPLKMRSDNARKFLSGEITKDVLDNTAHNAVAIQKTNLLGDPSVAQWAALSDLFKNNGSLLQAGDTIMVDYLKKGSGLLSTVFKPVDPTPSHDREKQGFGNYLSAVKLGMSQLNAGVNTGNTQVEISNNITSMLKGINAYKDSVDNAKDYNQVVDFLASPEFGKYMNKSGGVFSEAASKAKAILQERYEKDGLDLIRDEYNRKALNPGAKHANDVISVYAPNMQRANEAELPGYVLPQWNGSGVVFQPKEGLKDQDLSYAKSNAQDLNKSVAPLLNRLIRVHANLEGSMDYKKAYEDYYAPKLFPAPEAPKENPKQPSVSSSSGAEGDYEHMSHAELITLRNSLPPDSPKQKELASYEHQAFAREWAKESPTLATASLLAAIPAYTAAKGVGAVKSRTPASLEEMAAAYKGLGQGLGFTD